MRHRAVSYTHLVKIGDELSAAALTRGLGADVKRTKICKIGFRFVDYIVLLGCIITLAYLLPVSYTHLKRIRKRILIQNRVKGLCTPKRLQTGWQSYFSHSFGEEQDVYKRQE